MRRLKTNERGFSLVEVIVSIAILGILSVPILRLLNINIFLSMKSRNQLIATSLAQDKIEELKFSKTVDVGKEIIYNRGFVIEALTEIVDRKDFISGDEEEVIVLNDLYRLTVEVKKDDNIIEKLFTYKSSLTVQ